jgi:hypothetical protein
MIEDLSIISKVIGMLGSLMNWFHNLFQSERRLTLDHDIAVFRKLDAIANEPHLDDILNARIPNSRFRMKDHYVLADLIAALRRIENAFLDNNLKSRASALANELDQLLVFVMRTFFPIHSGYLKFYPYIIDKERYDAEWKELTQKIDKARDAYNNFRLAVKEYLKV